VDITVFGAPAEPATRPPRARRRQYADPVRAWVREEAQAQDAFEQSRLVGDASLEATLYAQWRQVLRRVPVSCMRRRGNAR
jgi:hypothetical protein